MTGLDPVWLLSRQQDCRTGRDCGYQKCAGFSNLGLRRSQPNLQHLPEQVLGLQLIFQNAVNNREKERLVALEYLDTLRVAKLSHAFRHDSSFPHLALCPRLKKGEG